MPSLVVATRNQEKLREIRDVLSDLSLTILSMNDFSDFPDVREDGQTLKENAVKKAKEIRAFTGLPSLADDTGLEVDGLQGKPGVYSSRYAGEHASYGDNVQKLLKELGDLPKDKRSARFRTVVAFVNDHQFFTTEGIQEGIILFEPIGDNGFGYDPVFHVSEYGQTFAQMSSDLKNRISHRSKALQSMKKTLLAHYEEVFHEKI